MARASSKTARRIVLHPLHHAVGQDLKSRCKGSRVVLLDQACGGDQNLPLFVGTEKSRQSRMCCVDAMVIWRDRIRALIEIEESGFLPTKVCGKFLQATLATHFIHASHGNVPIGYASRVLFVQIIDRSKYGKPQSQKSAQLDIIRRELLQRLPAGPISDYMLEEIRGAGDKTAIASVVTKICRRLNC